MTAYRYLLDTNILSDLIRNPTGLVARKIASSDVEQVCCTILIAAHARALRLTVVTANVREFLRVPGLAVENWLE